MVFQNSQNIVTVRILDHDYEIRSDDESQVRRVADYLNALLENIQRNTPVLNRIDLVVMTAFTIASEMLQARQDLDDFRKRVEEEAAALEARIDSNLS